MKRLALVVMVIATATFVTLAVTSAQEDWRAIHGTYASTGTGTCLNAGSTGFNGTYVPVAGPASFFGSQLYTGTWTFAHHGSGQFEGTLFGTAVPPNGAPNTFQVSFPFTYTFTDGVVNVLMDEPHFLATGQTGPLVGKTFTLEGFLPPTVPPGTTELRQNLYFAGMMSTDHKTMTLSMGNQIQKVTVSNGVINFQICNVGHVLIRVQ